MKRYNQEACILSTAWVKETTARDLTPIKEYRDKYCNQPEDQGKAKIKWCMPKSGAAMYQKCANKISGDDSPPEEGVPIDLNDDPPDEKAETRAKIIRAGVLVLFAPVVVPYFAAKLGVEAVVCVVDAVSR